LFSWEAIIRVDLGLGSSARYNDDDS